MDLDSGEEVAVAVNTISRPVGKDVGLGGVVDPTLVSPATEPGAD
jgi:hypothetical protein